MRETTTTMEPELVSVEKVVVEEEEEEKDCSWGTWEELLLAYAVNRYGKNNWESIAIEIQNKSSSPSLVPILTPENCQQRYHHLNEKYNLNHNLNKNNHVSNHHGRKTKINDGDDVIGDVITGDEEVPWVEELRKLRVAELRREVQRCDDSILSLQSQVKRFEDERDDDSKPDLEESEGPEKENFFTPGSSLAGTPGETEVVVPVVRDDESISDLRKVLDPMPEGAVVPVVEEPAGEGSCDGSSETIPKGPVAGKMGSIEKVKSPEKKGSSKVELVAEFESIADSKGGSGEGRGGTKENSDVQSSASLSRRKRRRTRRVSGISSEEDEPENEHIPPACRKLPVTCQPLMDVLDIIKSNQYGSIFERRRQNQKSTEYKFVIKRHIDLGMIESKLKEGRYSGNNGMHYFFRDLLLVSTNAITFFPPKSSEYHAATKMRGVILEELPKRSGRPSRSSKSESGSDLKLPLPIKKTPKLEPEPISEARLINPKSEIPFIACRKRSSVSTKARSERKDQKKATIATLIEIEVKPQLKPTPTPTPSPPSPFPPAETEDNVPLIVSKKKRDKPPAGARSSRGGNKKNSSTNALKNKPSPSSNASNKRVGGDNDISGLKNIKLEKVKEKIDDDDDLLASSTSVAKRQSVANFLNKMKKSSSSSSNKEKLSDTPKNTSGNNNSGSKKGNGRGGASSSGDGKRERQSSSKKQDQTSPAKRSVGRPPKRAPPPPPPPLSSSKRSRDAVETESPASKQPKKRAKK